MKKYTVLTALLLPVLVSAHETTPVTVTPATPAGGNQNNQNNRDDNLKHGVELVAVGGLVWCMVKGCGTKQPITFAGKQQSPNLNQP